MREVIGVCTASKSDYALERDLEKPSSYEACRSLGPTNNIIERKACA